MITAAPSTAAAVTATTGTTVQTSLTTLFKGPSHDSLTAGVRRCRVRGSRRRPCRCWFRRPIGRRRGHVAAVRSKPVLFPDLGVRCCLAGLEVTDFLAVAAGLAARDVATSVARGAESLP